MQLCNNVLLIQESSFSVMGPQIWNDIPLSPSNSLTLSSYKHKLRDYFQSL